MNSAAEKLFTKAALERLSSPEQLDSLMQVTRPVSWLALTTAGLCVFAALIWGIFGKIPTKVDGRGILLRGGAVMDVSAGSSGQLTAMLVQPGDSVKKGQVIAQIDQTNLSAHLIDLRKSLADLEAQHEAQAKSEVESSKSALEALAKERRNRESFNQEMDAQIVSLREKLANQEELREKGLVTASSVLQSKSALFDVQERLAQNQVRLAQIATDENELRGNLAKANDLRQQQSDPIRLRIREEERQLKESSQVKSHSDGRVLAVMVDPGNLVGPGTRLVSLETEDTPLEAVLFIPAGDGKKVQPGMEVRISPSTVKKEEFGFMLGQVVSVSSFPTTPDAMLRVLRNQALVAELSGGSAPLQVVARLQADPKTLSGYAWSSPQGPPVKVFSGTLCETSIVVQRKRPISYVVPMVKETLGLE